MDINVTGLTKLYGAQKALDNVSFHVKTGEIVGFLGPNGAGKTTAMKIITCYLSATSGEVKVGDYTVRNNSQEVKRMIGYLPEHNPLYLDMPVIDYLEFSALLQGVEKSKVQLRIREMVKKCGLNVEKHKKIGELSKGFRQRVGLAQAMIHDPQVLILDEPTTGLDPNQIVEIRRLIRELGKEKTVILSTHILPEVEATCDRILIISKGKIVADGTSDTLRKKSQGNEMLKLKIEDGNKMDILRALQQLETVALADVIAGSENVFEVQSKGSLSSRRNVFKLCVDNKWVLTEAVPYETKLEDIFRDLTIN